MNLFLERRDQENKTIVLGGRESAVLLAPLVTADYWQYRVLLSEGQAVVGFPKFGTIGIGFAVEQESWNTNLPYTSPAKVICEHIWRNRGEDATITKTRVLQAIRLIQDAAHEDHDG